MIGVEHVHSVMIELLGLIPGESSGGTSSALKFLEETEKDLAYLIQALRDLRDKVDEQCRLVLPPLDFALLASD